MIKTYFIVDNGYNAVLQPTHLRAGHCHVLVTGLTPFADLRLVCLVIFLCYHPIMISARSADQVVTLFTMIEI